MYLGDYQTEILGAYGSAGGAPRPDGGCDRDPEEEHVIQYGCWLYVDEFGVSSDALQSEDGRRWRMLDVGRGRRRAPLEDFGVSLWGSGVWSWAFSRPA